MKLQTGEILDSYIVTDSFNIQHNEDGTKVLTFSLSSNCEIYPKLQNETIIEHDDLIYLIKELNEDEELTEFVCYLDRDYFKQDIYTSFKSESSTEIDLFRKAVEGTQWIVSGVSNSKRKTIEMEDVTKLDIIIEISNAFGCYIDFDNKNHILNFVYPEDIPYKGLFVSEQVNLKKTSYVGDSYDLITRVYGYGKEDEETGKPLTFASINNGKEYVENTAYKKRIISKVIRDERFTNAESLLSYCQEELEKYSIPVESFDLTIIDLAQLKEDEYNLYQFAVRDLVDYIDRKRDKRVRHRIVQYTVYPFCPDKNKITLSNNPITLEKILSNSDVEIKELEKTTGNFLQEAQKEAAELINAFATKGHRYVTENETYYLDKLPKEAAKYVMRQNLGGIAFSHNGYNGPYVTAWTIDGKFNADFITTGTLRAIKIEAVDIVGGTITGTTIKGSTITGGKISGETTINVGTDLTVGDSIYVGQNQTSHFGGRKAIYFIDGIAIRFTKVGENGSIVMETKGAGSIRNNFDGYQSVVDANIGAVNLDVVYQGQMKNHFAVSNGATYSTFQITISSDRRLKENINDIDLIPLFDEVSVKRFDYKSGKKDSVGVIAQDYVDNPLSNYLLSKDEKGFYAVDYSVLYMASIQKIQQLEERIAQLEKLMGGNK